MNFNFNMDRIRVCAGRGQRIESRSRVICITWGNKALNGDRASRLREARPHDGNFSGEFHVLGGARRRCTAITLSETEQPPPRIQTRYPVFVVRRAAFFGGRRRCDLGGQTGDALDVGALMDGGMAARTLATICSGGLPAVISDRIVAKILPANAMVKGATEPSGMG